jgi:co-chaperonin GroES (HSP10)
MTEQVEQEQAEQTEQASATQLPRPSGWKILCAIPQIDTKFANSDLIKPDMVAKTEEVTTTVLFVLAVGPEAYADKVKFPNGPWCKEGDFILVRTYAGTRFKIHGKEFRLIHDDQVEAVVDDPRGYSRA